MPAHQNPQVQNGYFADLLSSLPEGTLYIKYSNIENLRHLIESQADEYRKDHSKSPFIAITDITPSVLQEFDEIYLDKGPRILAEFKRKIFIIETAMLSPHEVLVAAFNTIMTLKLSHMNLIDRLINKGRTRVKYSSFVKEPDSSWSLFRMEFPTLVLEVGLSEAVNQLAIEAHGWLEADGSETHVAITAKINRTTPQLVFELWERDAGRTGSMTRGVNMASAFRSQRVEISHSHGVTQVSGEIVIPFEKVLCRPAQAANERDFTFTKQELENIANKVWVYQQFM